ncbi:hypothetical protein TTHERM_00189560 (macronuclear) [Tetrahymena thermophila SB210]|uniref:Uncharacterized protein n=1 Tax=Tetrahymena thermophila (strain SB210) TaxID=312017 RepID=I7M1I1_TETTS|nr:hypothetical protein TTHERM_00189560 [Tetrahymena thermophila SB210]EAR96387.1 hypothetical protein TTHERM_00189560 [Tetrahymena thermophila SB210]|eukprot:XP_001016632.1 hypothetical protein TTHERM_00189560 [Tetrahymena thermophila SB210]
MLTITDEQSKNIFNTGLEQIFEREENQSNSLDQVQLPVQKIQLKKYIAKVKPSKSKLYKKKQLHIVPIVYQSLEISHYCIIFGYVILESQYRDYKSQSQINLQNNGISCLIKLNSIENKISEQSWVFNYQILGQSGIKDFSFLIDHYKKFSNQTYRQLALQLEEYQQKTQQILNYITDTSLKINSRIIDENDVHKAYQDFSIFFDNYVKANYSECDFISTSKIIVDYASQDFMFKDTTVSYSTLSLLGVEPQNSEIMFQKSFQNFNFLIGQERLQNIIRKLSFALSDQTIFEFVQEYFTLDAILFSAKSTYEIVYWPNAPNWMDKKSCFGVVNKIDLSLNQLKSIIQLRQNQTNSDLDLNSLEEDNSFEYQVQKEIFLQKFYPDLFFDPQTMKSIKLKEDIQK